MGLAEEQFLESCNESFEKKENTVGSMERDWGKDSSRSDVQCVQQYPCDNISDAISNAKDGEAVSVPADATSADMRTFGTGATRNTDSEKLDYEGFLSPLVLKRYAEYLHKNRHQADGKIRDSDNWQKGIPLPVYMKSLWRHFMDMWSAHRGSTLKSDLQEEAICAVLFNASGYLHELLKERK